MGRKGAGKRERKGEKRKGPASALLKTNLQLQAIRIAGPFRMRLGGGECGIHEKRGKPQL